jgi:hypothetical protein
MLVIKDLVCKVGPNGVNCVDCNSLGGDVLLLVYLLDKQTKKLVIVRSELLLDMKHKRNDALEQLLVSLERLLLKNKAQLVGDLIQLFKQDLIGAVNQYFGNAVNSCTLLYFIVGLGNQGKRHGKELVHEDFALLLRVQGLVNDVPHHLSKRFSDG